MLWLFRRTVRGAPRRTLVAAVAVAFPVAVLAGTLLFVDDSVRAMTEVALRPQQVEMRALMSSLSTDPVAVGHRLQGAPGVRHVDRFGAADVIVSASGTTARFTARLFAVDASYFAHHRWVRASGDVGTGALLDGKLGGEPGFATAASVTIDLRGDVAPLALTVPVSGRADLRAATTWFAIPSGGVQGDVAVVPRALVVDYSLFERAVLPALRTALGGASDATNAGFSELPPASVEDHVQVDHRTYPHDPARAAAWSASLRRVLERRAPGKVVVADNAEEPLMEASADATNARILFVLLGIPGVLVAAALGLAAASALAESRRREDALLRLRGATDAQLVRLAVLDGTTAGFVGTALGLVVAAAAVSAVEGHPAWRGVPASNLALTALLALAAGAVTTAARLVPLVRAGRRGALSVERRQVPGPWTPAWRRARLDLVLLGIGVAILAANILAGGLKPTPVPGQAVALSFYVLLAPLALWLGASLLVTRVLLGILGRSSRPDEDRQLSSWAGTAVRWLGRRPARTATAFIMAVLAVTFGTEVLTFVATYRSARADDARAAFGADLRLTPAADYVRAPPPLGPDVVATSPIRSVPARAGSDRKTIMAVDPSSYAAAAITAPRIVQGGGLEALRTQPAAVLVAQEVAKDYAVRPGDTLPVTVYPDDRDLSQNLNLRVVGVFRAFPPTDPLSEMVITTGSIPGPVAPPDFFLGRVADGQRADRAAAVVRQRVGTGTFAVSTITGRVEVQQRSLTALNLDGLSRIEAGAAALVAAVGVGVLGAFLVLERRREFAVLRAVGATRRDILVGPTVEGAAVTVGSLAVGIPLGLGLGVLAVRVLPLFFTLPPPLVAVPGVGTLALAGLVLVLSAGALAMALASVTRPGAEEVLREP